MFDKLHRRIALHVSSRGATSELAEPFIERNGRECQAGDAECREQIGCPGEGLWVDDVIDKEGVGLTLGG